jgi:hypothetical protein
MLALIITALFEKPESIDPRLEPERTFGPQIKASTTA